QRRERDRRNRREQPGCLLHRFHPFVRVSGLPLGMPVAALCPFSRGVTMNETDYRDEAARQFRGLKKAADRAIAQVSDADFFAAIDPESNSVALIVKHLAGNMRSRFTDFLTSDGEKPDRRRDSEFEIEPGDTRESLLARWEEGWKITAAAIE